MDIAALNSTKTIRNHVLKWMCVCLGFLSLIFAVFNLSINKSYLVGGLEIAFSALCFYIFNQLTKHYQKDWYGVALCLTLSFIILFGTYLAPFENGLFLWSFVLPILYYLLLGRRLGFILSATFLMLQSILLVYKSPLLPFVSVNLILNLLFIYISLWTVSHIFEGNRAQFSKRLKNLALLDPLTEAGNRLSMSHYFEIELKDKSNLYLFLLDLDYFKQVNDKYGHDIGDKVLVELTSLLRDIFPSGYIFRVGGEEFSLMGSFTSAESAQAMADKLIKEIAKKQIDIIDETITLTASIGLVNYQQHQSLSEFVNLADKELYKAKAAGRNCVFTNIN